MRDCVYKHIDDDGVIVCDKYSNFAKGIITFCDQKVGCAGKKPTNADKLRAMNDEELADLFTRIDAFCCPVKGADCIKEPSCTDCFSRWLKKECDE